MHATHLSMRQSPFSYLFFHLFCITMQYHLAYSNFHRLVCLDCLLSAFAIAYCVKHYPRIATLIRFILNIHHNNCLILSIRPYFYHCLHFQFLHTVSLQLLPGKLIVFIPLALPSTSRSWPVGFLIALAFFVSLNYYVSAPQGTLFCFVVLTCVCL